MTLYVITSNFFTAGFDYDDRGDQVTFAAPIIRYMLGWSIDKVRSYCAKRNWTLSEVTS